MPEEERTAILSKTGKKVAVATKGKKATAPTTEADVVDVDGDDESEKMEVDKPASKSKKGKAKAEPVEETEEVSLVSFPQIGAAWLTAHTGESSARSRRGCQSGKEG